MQEFKIWSDGKFSHKILAHTVGANVVHVNYVDVIRFLSSLSVSAALFLHFLDFRYY